MRPTSLDNITRILEQVRDLANQYHNETSKPLGITGEIAEFEAARKLGLVLSPARQSGFDAERVGDTGPKRVQIKGRRLADTSKQWGRIGTSQLDKEWDSVILVRLDDHFQPIDMVEAERQAVETALRAPGSKARNLRGSLSVSKFKSIGTCIWSRPR